LLRLIALFTAYQNRLITTTFQQRSSFLVLRKSPITSCLQGQCPVSPESLCVSPSNGIRALKHVFLKHFSYIILHISSLGRSQWPPGIRHELSSPAQTLRSWVRIPLKARIFVCAFILCLCCSVYRLPCDGLICRLRSPTYRLRLRN
jgi:hypothetical protein